MKIVKVAELFAGVGGFRIGLQRASKRQSKFQVVWSNQWEPGKKKQIASEIYVRHFGSENHSNKDIASVDIKEIPDFDLLVGGFPCQDYSVARPSNQADGIIGKKGVLWWDIYRILNEKKDKPTFLFLENVDRLLKSPAQQRGRDFAVMLASLSGIGYIVEWRVINAADYGLPQRRRRVFLLGYKNGSPINKRIRSLKNPIDWIVEKGLLAKGFPVATKQHLSTTGVPQVVLEGTLADISETFNKKRKMSPFLNSGILVDGKVWTIDSKPKYEGHPVNLADILEDGSVPDNYYLTDASIDKWRYLKGAKDEPRVKREGIRYRYKEGAIPFPDPTNRPSRTIITSEGGAAPSRFKHVIETKDGRLRRLTPVELEKLNTFPINHTAGYSDVQRAFLMGNALVVQIIQTIGTQLIRSLNTK